MNKRATVSLIWPHQQKGEQILWPNVASRTKRELLLTIRFKNFLRAEPHVKISRMCSMVVMERKRKQKLMKKLRKKLWKKLRKTEEREEGLGESSGDGSSLRRNSS